MRYINQLVFTIATILLFSVKAYAEDVEIYLLDRLDGNLNHYCIDMRGFQERADVNANLQTHTCYSYQGQLAVDQVMNTDDIGNGMFKLHAFNVCMSLNDTAAGSTIDLAECSEEDEMQKFELNAYGNIIPSTETRVPMCLTAGPSSWRGGPTGDSPHQIRTLFLQPCSYEAAAYQRWGTRSEVAQ